MPAWMDTLEPRLLCYFRNPTDFEQYFIELVNAYRNDPQTTANAFGIDLNEGLTDGTISETARQPLAPNAFLNYTAFAQAFYIRATFDVSIVDGFGGSLPAQRIQDNGYPQTGTFVRANEVVNLLTGPNTALDDQNVLRLVRNLIVDNGINGRVDRIALLDDTYREVGAGLRFDPPANAPTGPALAGVLDLATATGGTPSSVFLTGVAYDDQSNDNFYEPGEGLGNVSVTARNISTGVTYSATTYAAGGYSLALPPGTYDVIGQGGQFGNTSAIRYGSVVIGSKNVKRDFRLQDAGPAVPDPFDSGVPNTVNPATITGDLSGKIRYDRRGDSNSRNLRKDDRLVGAKVYVDLNNSGSRGNNEPYGTVQKDGTYRITGLDPGIYTVRVEPPTGFRVSIPEETFYKITITSGEDSKVPLFALTDKTIISGRVYKDVNANGNFDDPDKGLKNWRVYLDVNGDGIWQEATEPSRVTPQSGKYSFRDVAAGNYTVRVIPKAGFLQTEPTNNAPYIVAIPATGLSSINRDFGEKLIG